MRRRCLGQAQPTNVAFPIFLKMGFKMKESMRMKKKKKKKGKKELENEKVGRNREEEQEEGASRLVSSRLVSS